jgi:hypothetical protein
MKSYIFPLFVAATTALPSFRPINRLPPNNGAFVLIIVLIIH